MNDPSSAKIKTANIVGICNPRKFSPAKIKAHTVYISINQSINGIRVHHATKALGHNVVQSSTMTT